MAAPLLSAVPPPPTEPYGGPVDLLPRVPLRKLFENGRFWHMDRLEQYYRGTQDDGKRFNWDGSMRTMSSAPGVLHAIPTAPGFVASLSDRRPSTRKRFAMTITNTLTEFAIDGAAFPEIHCEGDEVAEQSLRDWSKLMGMPTKMAEVRTKGGQTGTGCFSLGIVAGAFAIDVHNAKHCMVLEWANRQRFLPARVLKAYVFSQNVIEGGQLVAKDFWFVRYWDSQMDITWEAVPDELARQPDWMLKAAPSFVGPHRFGFCPFYWVQNLPDSEEEDGEGDYEGLEDKLDEYNQLLSATTKGTKLNVDPTLVIHDEDPGDTVQAKGSGAAIYAPQGAEYLELKGTASKTALELLNELRASIYEEAQVVKPKEEKLTGHAQSAAAMRILYAPQIARANKLRAQYEEPIKNVLQDMLKIMRAVRAKPAVDVFEEGRLVGARKEAMRPDMDPGKSEIVTLKWAPYFQPTSQDMKDVVAVAQQATGGKPLLSQESGVDFVGSFFGIDDTDAELAKIEEDEDKAAERNAAALQTEVDITKDTAPTPDDE